MPSKIRTVGLRIKEKVNEALRDSIDNKKHILFIGSPGFGIFPIINDWAKQNHIKLKSYFTMTQAGLEGTVSPNHEPIKGALANDGVILLVTNAIEWKDYHFTKIHKAYPDSEPLSYDVKCLIWVVTQPRKLTKVEKDNFNVVNIHKIIQEVIQ